MTIVLILTCAFFIFSAVLTYAQVDSRKTYLQRDAQTGKIVGGTVHIALAWGQQLQPPREMVRGFLNLREAMLKWTDLSITIDNHLLLSSNRLHDMPFVYITTDRLFELTSTEVKNVEKYLKNGGFMVLEAATSRENNPAVNSFEKMLRDALGAHSRLAPIPKTHPLYHSFFDFEEGPPEMDAAGRDKPVYYLEGVFYQGRLIAILSKMNFIGSWQSLENDPQLKMGVNMVMFALDQKGGIAAADRGESK